jgi:hypothetical protein
LRGGEKKKPREIRRVFALHTARIASKKEAHAGSLVEKGEKALNEAVPQKIILVRGKGRGGNFEQGPIVDFSCREGCKHYLHP